MCLKLDALSHFHFAPKPVSAGTPSNSLLAMADLLVINYFLVTWQIIEDMSIQANVPALAMEEVTNLFLGNMNVY